MSEEQTQPKDGYIIDFISGVQVKASPEEVEATQVFSKILVEDYGYPKTQIQTRPQFHVKVRPSDTKKEYPVDIAVFNNTEHNDDSIYLIVECKKKNRKDGRTQLENYLTLSKANLGVWFNGEERFYLLKQNTDDGRVLFKDIPNIPKFGERLEDIGAIKRGDLIVTHNLKSTFKAIRNYLAANAIGATRDEILAQQLINLIFCKIYDEKYTGKDNIVRFRVGFNETITDVRSRIDKLFSDVKTKYKEVFTKEDVINLDDNSVSYIVGELQNYCLIDAERDVLADAFETFIDHALKGGQGQFFTPRNVVKMMVEILDPDDDDMVIDPACGSGGFIIESLRYIWNKIVSRYREMGWSDTSILEEKIDVANKCIRGIDKDYFLSKIAKAYMAIMGDGKGGVFCEDSLERPENWSPKTQQKIDMGKFDVVLTNPPFGSKIPVTGEDKLKQYELAHKWKNKKGSNEWEKGKLSDKEAPQILFIERCYQLLKFGGRMAIVLPEGIFGNPTDRYIWSYILNHSRIEAIISTPAETFQPNTHFKTSVLIIQKTKDAPNYDYPIFMGIANTCGHNKNGKDIFKINADGTYLFDENSNKIIDDELPLVAEKYRQFKSNLLKEYSHNGFVINFSEVRNNIFIPDYYDPELKKKLMDMNFSNDYSIKSIGELVTEKVISTRRGNEIGSQFYGNGDIPFIRTSDIVNWELKIDPTKCVPEDVYKKYKKNQDIKANDILFVKDGTFLIGRSAIVSKSNERIIIQSHLIKIRVHENDLINPFYFLYLLNLPIVQQQIKRYTFIQGTLSTIGERFFEIKLPIHNDKEIVAQITNKVKSIILQKEQLQQEMMDLVKL